MFNLVCAPFFFFFLTTSGASRPCYYYIQEEERKNPSSGINCAAPCNNRRAHSTLEKDKSGQDQKGHEGSKRSHHPVASISCWLARST